MTSSHTTLELTVPPCHRLLLVALLAGALLLAVGATLPAAEIQLRTDARPTGGMVLLGDIADIRSSNADEVAPLEVIDLMPSPTGSERRVVRLREVQDQLALRGFNLSAHRFSGASQVTITTAVERPRAAGPKRLNAATVRQATETARLAIVGYLQDKAGPDAGWQVEPSLTDEQAEAIAASQAPLTVSGGVAPWTGAQTFQFQISPTNIVAVATQVVVPPSVVVATASIQRGALIRPIDVKLQPGKASEGKTHVFTSLDEVIGKEASRAIGSGQILDDAFVRPQLFVRRSDIVTVYARAAGIAVRTTGRAREDGAMGDVITVETLEDRTTFLARVSAAQEVEVFARSASVSASR